MSKIKTIHDIFNMKHDYDVINQISWYILVSEWKIENRYK